MTLLEIAFIGAIPSLVSVLLFAVVRLAVVIQARQEPSSTPAYAGVSLLAQSSAPVPQQMVLSPGLPPMPVFQDSLPSDTMKYVQEFLTSPVDRGVERAVERLMKGDSRQTIQIAESGLKSNFRRWFLLYQEIRLTPADIKAQKPFQMQLQKEAGEILARVKISSMKNAAKVLVSSAWQLNFVNAQNGKEQKNEEAEIWQNMGKAYTDLADIGRHSAAYREAALNCYDCALNLYTATGYTAAQAYILRQTGNIHLSSATRNVDVVASLCRAIESYKRAVNIVQVARDVPASSFPVAEINNRIQKLENALARLIRG